MQRGGAQKTLPGLEGGFAHFYYIVITRPKAGYTAGRCQVLSLGQLSTLKPTISRDVVARHSWVEAQLRQH